jgi:hypothetical protein
VERQRLVGLSIGIAAATGILAYASIIAFGVTVIGSTLAGACIAIGAAAWGALFTEYSNSRPRPRDVPPVHLDLASKVEREEYARRILATVPGYLKGLVRQHGLIAIGPLLEVCTHTRLRMGEGWTLGQVRYIRAAPTPWVSDRLTKEYETFKDANRGPPENLEIDLEKIMLVRPPSTQEKLESFPVYWTTGLYSEMRFNQVRFGDTVGYNHPPRTITRFQAGTVDKRRQVLGAYAAKVFAGSIPFPASVSIHCLVTTTDEKLVVCKRGPDVIYFPNQWNVTLDENIRYKDDFEEPQDKDFIGNCIVRGLRQELVGMGIKELDFLDRSQIRLLSFFIEGNLPGVGICAHVPLRLSSDQVEVEKFHRPDRQETLRLEYLPLDHLEWNLMADSKKFTGGWGWGSPFLLMLFKLYRGDSLLEALPPEHASFLPTDDSTG